LAIAFVEWNFSHQVIEVWLINLEKHRGFYQHFPRGYFSWVFVNVLEFSLVAGVPILLCGFSLVRRSPNRHLPLAAWVMLTLLALDLTGKNLSEVARLWLFLTPIVCAAGAPAVENIRSRWILAALLAIQAWLLVSLVANVEPILPIAV
jgi:hypothetical protein